MVSRFLQLNGVFPCLPAGVLLRILNVFCCYRVLKTGRDNYWLYLILIFQPLGAVRETAN